MQCKLIIAALAFMLTGSIFSDAGPVQHLPKLVNGFAPQRELNGDLPPMPIDLVRPSVHYDKYGTVSCFPNTGFLDEKAHNFAIDLLEDLAVKHNGVGGRNGTGGTILPFQGVYTFVCGGRSPTAVIHTDNLKYVLRTIEYWCGLNVTGFYTLSDAIPELEGLTVGKSNAVWTGCPKPSVPGQYLPDRQLLRPAA